MKRNRRFLHAIAILVALAVVAGGSLAVWRFAHQTDGEVPLIGVMCWNGENELTDAVHSYISSIEASFPVRFQYVTPNMGYYSYAEMAQSLCESGCAGIINVSTDSLPEIMEVCENNQVYLVQLWDIADDTDVWACLSASKYFLGVLQNDDKGAAQLMADKLVQSGARRALSLNYSYMTQSTQAHNVRSRYFIEAFEKAGTASELKTSSYGKALDYVAETGVSYDAILLTSGYREMPLSNVKALLGDPEIRFAYFNTNEHTRLDLESENALLVACGQQNLFGFAFCLVYAAIEGNPVQGIRVSCPYIYLSSSEEYDLYKSACVESMPYGPDVLAEIIESLEDGADALARRASLYSIDRLTQEATER